MMLSSFDNKQAIKESFELNDFFHLVLYLA